jgi:hypothetical protein
MKVTLLLADAAQAVEGKLYVLGGGWSITGPGPSQFGVAIKIDVPWDEANRPHKLHLALLDSDGHPVRVPTPTGENPVEVGADFEVGRPAGLRPGTPLDFTMAVTVGPIQLPANGRFVWRLSIDGHSDEDWQVAFSTRPAEVKP